MVLRGGSAISQAYAVVEGSESFLTGWQCSNPTGELDARPSEAITVSFAPNRAGAFAGTLSITVLWSDGHIEKQHLVLSGRARELDDAPESSSRTGNPPRPAPTSLVLPAAPWALPRSLGEPETATPSVGPASPHPQKALAWPQRPSRHWSMKPTFLLMHSTNSDRTVDCVDSEFSFAAELSTTWKDGRCQSGS